MSGPKPKAVWRCFVRDNSVKTNVKATCRGCGEELQGIVPRLEKHASACRRLRCLGLWGVDSLSPNLSPSQSTAGSSPSSSSLAAPDEEKEPSDSREPASESSGPPRKKVCFQTTLPVVRTGPEKLSELSIQLCRFMVTSNSPFSLVEDPEFEKFVHLLRPGVHIPNRRSIGGPVLDALYDTELERVSHAVEGKFGTICVDGWSTVTAEPVIGISLCVGGRSYLRDTVDTTGHPHTMQYLAGVVEP